MIEIVLYEGETCELHCSTRHGETYTLEFKADYNMTHDVLERYAREYMSMTLKPRGWYTIPKEEK